MPLGWHWNTHTHTHTHLWRCFHWPTWMWIAFNRFPTPLKLLGPKLNLILGRWNITIYSIHPLMDFFQLLPFLCEEFYHGTKLQSLMFIVDPHAIALAILSLPALTSDWFVNVAATCPNLHMQGHAFCCNVRYWGRLFIERPGNVINFYYTKIYVISKKSNLFI